MATEWRNDERAAASALSKDRRLALSTSTTLGGLAMTSSERYFERFCERRGIAIRRLPEGPDKTPDYEIVVDGIEIVAEVKQIEPNAEDRDVLTEVASGKAAPTG
jgi:hypothetical protein